MISLKILSKNDVMQVMEMGPVIDCTEDVYCQKSKKDAVVWPTIFYEFEPGQADMDIKSGFLKGAELYGHKTVSWFGGNLQHGLPELSGVIVIYSAKTGLPVCVLDGTYITGVRTGAAGAIGAKYLARKDSKNLVIAGSGNQAAFQIAASLTAIPGLKKVTVANAIAPEDAERFVKTLPQRLKEEFSMDTEGILFQAAPDMKAALWDADIVITVTPAKKPFIKKEWVRPGTHFSCIGSDMSGKEELEGEILADARIFVDDRSHCIADGEIEIPIKQNIISEQDIAGEIGDLILGKTAGRQSDEEITIFDATGMALLDIAAAGAALKLADAKGIGTIIEL
ncbi:MAG: ornithine cyclodeaminase family protein [Firmicutes bacterium]|nr:ornithine cyclodeaminase family protein [Bacillota bacterium]